MILVLIRQLRLSRVSGDSMNPCISNGDFVIYRPFENFSNSLLLDGFLAVIKHPLEQEKLIIKRIIKTSFSGVQVKGDNEDYSQDSRHFGYIRNQNIIGIVKYIIANN